MDTAKGVTVSTGATVSSMTCPVVVVVDFLLTSYAPGNLRIHTGRVSVYGGTQPSRHSPSVVNKFTNVRKIVVHTNIKALV